MRHYYLSTSCQHEEHDACRLVCKYADKPDHECTGCLCPHHHYLRGMPEPIPLAEHIPDPGDAE